MKKPMMLALVLVVAGAAQAMEPNPQRVAEIRDGLSSLTNAVDRKAYMAALSDDDFRMLVEDQLSVWRTNRTAGVNYSPSAAWSVWCNAGKNHPTLHTRPELGPEFDEKFAEAGVFYSLAEYARFPKACEAWLLNTNGWGGAEFAAKRSLHVALLRKYKSGKLGGIASIPERLNAAYEFACSGRNMWQMKTGSWKKTFIKDCQPFVRKSLRDRGKSFVAHDGINPLQDAVDALAKALNAPKLAGLKEWVAEYAPDYKWVDCEWPSDEKALEWKNAVFYGDKPFSPTAAFFFECYLGVEEYNKFVKQYNEGTAE